MNRASEEGRFVIYEEHKEISVLDLLVGRNSQSCYLECVCVFVRVCVYEREKEREREIEREKGMSS